MDAIARRLFYAPGTLSSIIDSQRVAAAAAAAAAGPGWQAGSLWMMAVARRHTAHLGGHSVGAQLNAKHCQLSLSLCSLDCEPLQELRREKPHLLVLQVSVRICPLPTDLLTSAYTQVQNIASSINEKLRQIYW